MTVSVTPRPTPHTGDSVVEECQPWCNGDYLEDHCGWCACKGCRFCRVGGKDCQSFFLTGDTDHEACEPFCREKDKDTHCGMCKCKGCGFCKALARASVSQASAPSLPACYSGRKQDSLVEKCDPFCKVEQKDDHCGQCKCKACRFCGDVCDSGIPGDLHVRSCSPGCHQQDPAAVCPLCKCRSCPFCIADGGVSEQGMSAEATVRHGQSVAAGTTACHSGVTGDVSYRSCVPGLCDVSKRDSHCQTCRCQGCSWCQAPPPSPPKLPRPPPPPNARGGRGPEACSSGHLSDTVEAKCEPWCTDKGLPSAAVCGMCACKTCGRCKDVRSVAQPPLATSHAGEDGCPLEIELSTVSTKREKAGWYAHRLSVRVDEWQPDTVVTVDFSAADARVAIDAEDVQSASLVGKPPPQGAFTHSFRLGPRAASMRGFSFTGFTGRESLGRPQPHLSCSHAMARPSPPPPPPPAPPPPAPPLVQHACALGGLFKLGLVWAGGTSFRAKVTMAVWRPGAFVTLDFRESAGVRNVQNLGASQAENAEVQPSPYPGSIRVRLAAEPDVDNGFSIHAHNGKVGDLPPAILCSVAASTAQASSGRAQGEEGAAMDESCATVAPYYKMIQSWNGGFKAAVILNQWLPGARIFIKYATFRPHFLSAWGAAGQDVEGGIRFELAANPAVGDNANGFAFTARGDSDFAAQPSLRCVVNREAAATVKVPVAQCGMGANYWLLPVDDSAPVATATAAAAAKGGPWRVHIGLQRWEPGARLDLTFSSLASVAGADGATHLNPGLSKRARHSFAVGSGGVTFIARTAVGDSLTVVRLSCRPKDAAEDEAPEGVTVGAPDAPAGLTVARASCNDAEVAWDAAVDNGLRVTGYTVTWRRQDAPGEEGATGEAAGTSFVLSGLSGGTTYLVQVQGRNSKGPGRMTRPLRLTTDSGGAPLIAASAPKPSRSHSCRRRVSTHTTGVARRGPRHRLRIGRSASSFQRCGQAAAARPSSPCRAARSSPPTSSWGTRAG